MKYSLWISFLKRENKEIFHGVRSHACVLGYKWLITLMIKVGYGMFDLYGMYGYYDGYGICPI